MKARFQFYLMFWLAGLVMAARAADADSTRSPFGVKVASDFNGGAPVLKVDFTVPAGCVLYYERLHFLAADGTELTPQRLPAPIIAVDQATGHEKKLYDRNFSVLLAPVGGELTVKFQGCTNAACFFPEKRTFAVKAAGGYAEVTATPTEMVAVAGDPAAASTDWQTPAKDFQVIARETGYVKSGDFVRFLNQAASGQLQVASDPLAKYKRFGIIATVCLILLGGLGLNLTPCVLPLIPINLAIIGAGRAAHTRREGFLHGAAYGLGMSLAYGVLGLAVVLTGAKFGTLNSSIWFNVAIALIFAVLALAMFDVFHIDFTRFDRLLGKRESRVAHQTRSKWLVAFTLGAIAALLAGACVAPVVISVLLMATDLHAKGAAIGLALPFLLGVGMALPWPFMGASLSFLPKPGKWMVGVKYGFGVAILLFALYYGNIAYGLLQSRHTQSSLAAAPAAARAVEGGDQTLAQALHEAQATGKPVFVDFAASWCKNCEAMDFTVFNQSNVQRRLQDFVLVRYQAERPNEPPAKDVLDHFKVLGLPTYLVLSAK
ncbi:MAG: cytochrome c biogenesis protein CcdA [Verrucomicrobiae bacterium]|nr:cytochrome c biogenesis protein CcdA [Verrucomicrobiae bacterium]